MILSERAVLSTAGLRRAVAAPCFFIGFPSAFSSNRPYGKDPIQNGVHPNWQTDLNQHSSASQLPTRQAREGDRAPHHPPHLPRAVEARDAYDVPDAGADASGAVEN